MVTSAEITDRESLERWLKGRSQADAVAIALRSACRVLPLWGREMDEFWARKFDLTALTILRLHLTLRAARKYPALKVRAATDATIFAFVDEAVGSAYGYASDAATKAFAIFEDAASAAMGTASSFADVADAAAMAASVDDPSKAPDATAIWDCIRSDALALERGEDIVGARLWDGAEAGWFTVADAEMQAIWARGDAAHWAFWTRWWDGVKQGRDLDWDLQREVAEIDEAIWAQGPGAVAKAIARIEAGHEMGADPDRAVDVEVRKMPDASQAKVRQIQLAIVANRDALPPTFDAIEGLIALEIELEQGRNHFDDFELAEAKRRIGVLLVLNSAIARMRMSVPVSGPVSVAQAEEVEKLHRLLARKILELPRAKVDEMVDGIWSGAKGAVSVGLIFGCWSLAGYLGLPPYGGLIAGAMVFAPKHAPDIIKAAKEFVKSDK